MTNLHQDELASNRSETNVNIFFQVFFEQPAQVEPEQFYTASVVLDGGELSYFGQEGMSDVSVGGVNFQFQCSAESTNGTGVQGGQVTRDEKWGGGRFSLGWKSYRF